MIIRREISGCWLFVKAAKTEPDGNIQILMVLFVDIVALPQLAPLSNKSSIDTGVMQLNGLMEFYLKQEIT